MLNVNEVLRLPARQFVELLVYKRMEPFREFRADFRAAQIVTMVYNMAVAVKDRKKVDYFMPKWGEQEAKPRKQSWQEQLAILKVLAITNNAAPEARE